MTRTPVARRRHPRKRLSPRFRLELEPLENRWVPSAVRFPSGWDASTFPGNDDSSTGPVAIGFQINFFGVQRDQLFVNNNGNVTFDFALGTYTPFPLNTTQEIIAPFFADVDTRPGDSGKVKYGQVTVDGHPSLAVTWDHVGYYSSGVDKKNLFQVVLIQRADTGLGNFDIELNYDQVQWEAGSASGGSGGLGGSSARAGFSNGTTTAGTFFELPGSAVNGALLDDNLTSGLIHNSLNSTVLGRYRFEVRNGQANVAPHNITVASLPEVIRPGQPITLTGTFADPDNNTWAGTFDPRDGSGPVPLVINQAARTFTVTYTYQEPGAYEGVLRIGDGLATGEASVPIEVVAPIAPPQLFPVPVPPGPIPEGTALALPVAGFDPDTPPFLLEYALTGISRVVDQGEEQIVIPLSAAEVAQFGATLAFMPPVDPPIVAAQADVGGEETPFPFFTWTPREEQGPGTYEFTVQVMDEGGRTDTEAFRISVAEENRPPVLRPIGPQLLDEGTELRIPLSASDPDLPSNSLSFALVSGPDGSSLVVDGGITYFVWRPADDLETPAIVTIRATDDGNPSLGATESFAVTVANVRPIVVIRNPDDPFSSGNVPFLGTAGDAFTAGGFMLDRGADALTAIVNWGDGSDPDDDGIEGEHLTLGPGGTFALNHTYATEGTFLIRVIATDDGGDTGQGVARITLLPSAEHVGDFEFHTVGGGETLEKSIADEETGLQGTIEFERTDDGTEPVSVFFGLYKDNPLPQQNPNAPRRTGDFFDLQVTGAAALTGRLKVTINTQFARGDFDIGYFDSTTRAWISLLGRPDLVTITVDSAAGTITLEFTSDALVSIFGGTVFTISLPQATPTTASVVAPVASASATGSGALARPVTFISNAQLSLSITSSQDSNLSVSGRALGSDARALGKGSALGTSTNGPTSPGFGVAAGGGERSTPIPDSVWAVLAQDERAFKIWLDDPDAFLLWLWLEQSSSSAPAPAAPAPQQAPPEEAAKEAIREERPAGELPAAVPAKGDAMEDPDQATAAEFDSRVALGAAVAVPLLGLADWARSRRRRRQRRRF